MSAKTFTTFGTHRDLHRAALKLARQCAVMRGVHQRTGTPDLRAFDANFTGLAKIVTGQQLSAQSAAAIWQRVASGIVPFDAERVQRMRETQLARLGLSRPKIKTLKALAAATAHGTLDFDALNAAPDADVIAALTALHGIGPWTADIYLLFALRRADAFPAGDLALQLAAARVLELDAKPDAKALIEIAERWRPWRGAAAHLLWAEYALHQHANRKKRTKSEASL